MLKKLLPIIGIFLALVTTLLAMENNPKRPKVDDVLKVIIQTQEGDEFSIPVSYARLSSTLKNLMEDAGIDAPLPLPNITSEQWVQISQLLELAFLVQENPEDAAKYKQTLIQIVQTFTANDLISFVQAVNYLDIPILLDSGLRAISIKHADIPKELLRALPIDLVRRAIHNLLITPDFHPTEWQSEEDGNVFSIAQLKDNLLLIEYYDRIAIWDFTTQQEISSIETDFRPIHGIQATPDGTRIIVEYEPTVPSDDEEARNEEEQAPAIPSDNLVVYDRATGKKLVTLQDSIEPNLVNAFITPDGTKFVQVTQLRLQVWDLATGLKIQQMKGNFDEFGNKVLVDNGKIYAVTKKNSLSIYDIASGAKFGVHQISDLAIEYIKLLNSKFIIAQLIDGTLVVWNTLTYGVVAMLPAMQDQLVRGQMYTGSQRSFLAGTHGKKIIVVDPDSTKLWDLETKSVRVIVHQHLSGVPKIALTYDGKAIVGQFDFGDYYNATLHVWDIETGEEIATLLGDPRNDEAILEHLFISDHYWVCGIYDAHNHQDYDFKIWNASILEALKTMNFVQAQVIWSNFQAGSPDWEDITYIMNIPALQGANAVLPSDSEITQIIDLLNVSNEVSDAESEVMDGSD